MKPGINMWALPGSLGWEEALGLVARAGFAAVEPNIEKEGWITGGLGPGELAARRGAVKAAGLEIAGLSSGLLWETSLTGPTDEERRNARSLVETQLGAAAALGAGAALVVPGAVDVFFMPSRPRVRYDHAMERLVAAIEALLPVAEREGVVLAIETVWNRFLLSPLEVRALVDRFASKWFGVYLDVGNLMAMGYPQDWIEILGPRVARVHVKGYRRSGGLGTSEGFCGLLAGEVNWAEVMGALARAGYDGYVTAELFRPSRVPPDLFLSQAARELRWILERAGGAGA